VRDAVEAIIALSERPAAVGEVFNVGSSEEVAILELARRVWDVVGLPPNADQAHERIVFVPYEQAYAVGFEDMLRRVPDTSKLRQLTGWAPQRSLDETIRDVVAGLAAGRSVAGSP
jgi:UDP-glucose 4-epimerase